MNSRVFFFLFLVQNALQIIPLADEYGVTDVLEKCEGILAHLCETIYHRNKKRLTVDVIVDFIITAEKHNLQGLLSSATQLCAKYNSDLVEQQTRIGEVSIGTRYNIARKRNALFEEYTLKKITAELEYDDFNLSDIEFPYQIFDLQP
jgi:hypothetical protein